MTPAVIAELAQAMWLVFWASFILGLISGALIYVFLLEPISIAICRYIDRKADEVPFSDRHRQDKWGGDPK